MFVFGTQYLRGASPERDQWEKDLINIKKAGFNTVRAWFVWNAIERREGEIDYEYISEFLSLAEKVGLKVGILFHMHACPDWAVKKYPQYFYEDEKQIPFQPAVRANTPSGNWPGLCYDHEEVREMEKRFIEGVIKETKKYSCVSFYEPMNEPHQWNDFRQNPIGIFCYCDASVKKFREWLKEKYKTIDNLNVAWGHFYDSFDEVRPPRWTSSYADYTDFRLFNMDNVKREIQFRAEIIRSCDDKPVIAHAWGGGAVTCANLGSMAFDDWKNAEVFDSWGYSAFPRFASDCASLGLGSEATRCAANGKDYWQSELTAGLVGTGLEVKGRIDDETFDKFNLESIRHGAKGLLYWQYRKERFGAEWGGFALTDYDGGPTNLLNKASDLCKSVLANEEYFCNGICKQAEVGLVFSVRSYLANWVSRDKFDNKFAVDSMSGYYKMLWEENIPVDIIHEDYEGFAADLSKYKVIILPSPYAVSVDFSKRLKEYIKNGGTIISDPFYGAFEQDFKLSYQVPGHGFSEVFGLNEFDMREADSVNVKSGDKVYTISGTKQFELFRDVKSKVLFASDKNVPIVLSNNFGKGRAVIFATNLGLSYSSRALVSDDIVSDDSANQSDFAKEIVMNIVYEAGVERNFCTAEGVKVSIIDSKDGKSALVIIINSNQFNSEGYIKFNKKCCDYNVVYGKIDCDVDNGDLKIKIGADKSAMVTIKYDL